MRMCRYLTYSIVRVGTMNTRQHNLLHLERTASAILPGGCSPISRGYLLDTSMGLSGETALQAPRGGRMAAAAQPFIGMGVASRSA